MNGKEGELKKSEKNNTEKGKNQVEGGGEKSTTNITLQLGEKVK